MAATSSSSQLVTGGFKSLTVSLGNLIPPAPTLNGRSSATEWVPIEPSQITDYSCKPWPLLCGHSQGHLSSFPKSEQKQRWRACDSIIFLFQHVRIHFCLGRLGIIVCMYKNDVYEILGARVMGYPKGPLGSGEFVCFNFSPSFTKSLNSISSSSWVLP